MTKVLISVADDLLADIDAVVREEGWTRSSYVVRLASDDLANRRQSKGQKRKEALEAIDRLFARNPTPGDVTELIRQERDAR